MVFALAMCAAAVLVQALFHIMSLRIAKLCGECWATLTQQFFVRGPVELVKIMDKKTKFEAKQRPAPSGETVGETTVEMPLAAIQGVLRAVPSDLLEAELSR